MSSSQILVQAELAHQQGQLAKASALYQQVLDSENNVDALYGLATLSHQQGNFKDAKSLFKKALMSEPQAFDINFNYLLTLIADKDIDAAKVVLANTVKLSPTNDKVKIHLGQIAFQLGLSELCLIVTPESTPQGRIIRCNAYIQLEQWLDGYTIAKSLYQQFPTEQAVLQALSICAAKLDKYDEAITVFQTIVDQAPNNSMIQLKFADLFLMAKQLKNARRHLDIAISLNDQSITRFEIECKVCRLENNKPAALKAAYQGIQLKPEAEFAWQVIQDLGDNKENQQCIESLKAYTQDTSVYSYDLQHNLYTLAKAQQKDEQFQAAFNTFDKANKLQAERFKAENNIYNPNTQLKAFDHIKSINYPPCPLHSEQTEHFFIVGMPRSGTTLVNRVLSQMAEASSCGESNAVATLFENKLYDENLSPDSLNQWLVDNAKKHGEFYKAFNKLPSKISVDKMPHNFRYVGAILSTFPNAKVIQMRRAPQDLALSIYSQFFNQQHNYSCDLVNIAHAITYANRLMDHWLTSFPDQVIDISYQDLASTPNNTFSAMFEALGLNWKDEYLNFHKENVASYTFSETQVRKPINKSKIGFSAHYNEEMKVFSQTYTQLSDKY